jgi:hypothetical protein
MDDIDGVFVDCNAPGPAHGIGPLYLGIGPTYVATLLRFRPRFTQNG